MRTFTGNVTLKHVGGGTVACTASGAIQIDVYSLANIVPGTAGLANVSLQAGQCFTAQEKYTASANGNGWTLLDPITNVPGSLTPVTNGYRMLLIMRLPTEPQSNFTQVTGTNLAEATTP